MTLPKIGYSIPEVAGILGVSESLLYLMANKGTLPGCRRMGNSNNADRRGRFVIHLETVVDWLKSGVGDEETGKE